MKQLLCLLVLIIFSTLLVTCGQQKKQLCTGDLLFVEAQSDSLSAAIDRVTHSNDEHHFSHIALVEIEGQTTWVLHADVENGSERIPLNEFLMRKKNRTIAVFRLKKEYQNSIPNALKKAHSFLDKPYNFSYILSENSFYCSDFIQRSFASDSIFKLEPMTFINPETQKIDSVWINYYAEMQLSVPEGFAGCNPNGIASSDKLRFIGNYPFD